MVLRTAEVLVLFVTDMPSLVEIMYKVLWFHCVRRTLSSCYRRSQHTDIYSFHLLTLGTETSLVSVSINAPFHKGSSFFAIF